jgi:hypothetical protein
MWSHSINDGNLGGGEGAQPQISGCRACDRGNSAQDVRHTMTSNWVYSLRSAGVTAVPQHRIASTFSVDGKPAASGPLEPVAC